MRDAGTVAVPSASPTGGCNPRPARESAYAALVMDLWLAVLVILGAAALSAGGMLLLRSRAPEGTYFKDPIPAGAVYTVVGTAYMVIVAFVFFVAFESYGGAKANAEEEATATLAMFHAALPFNQTARIRLHGQVICYAREVIDDGWRAMREGEASATVDARVTALEETASEIELQGEHEVVAYDHWLALNEERRKGRQGRIGESSGLVPPVLWLILIVGGVVVIAAVGFFADPRESRVTQGAMIAAVAVIVASGLVLVRFLDRPYHDKSGGIKPTAMERTLAQMEREQPQAVMPCE